MIDNQQLTIFQCTQKETPADQSPGVVWEVTDSRSHWPEPESVATLCLAHYIQPPLRLARKHHTHIKGPKQRFLQTTIDVVFVCSLLKIYNLLQLYVQQSY